MKMPIVVLLLGMIASSGCMESKGNSKADNNNSFETAQSIPTRTLVDGSLSEGDEVDYYSFQLAETKNVFFYLSTTGGLNAQVSLYSEDKILIEGVEASYTAEKFSSVLDEGQYYLAVNQLGGSGEYRVKAGWDSLVEDSDLLPNISVGGYFSDSPTVSERNNYALLIVDEPGVVKLRLDAKAEDRLTVFLTTPSPDNQFINEFSLNKGQDVAYHTVSLEAGEYIVNVFLETPSNTSFVLSYLQ